MDKSNNLPVYEHTQPNGETYYTAPNQKDIHMKRPKVTPPFSSIEKEYKYKAMRTLTGGGYKLWSYFIDNKNNRRFGLSYKTVGNLTGISKSTYDRGVKELIDNGYLIRYKDTNFYYCVVDNDLNGMDADDYFKWCDDTYNTDNDDR